MKIHVRKMDTGHYRIEGEGSQPEWIQVPTWPASNEMIHGYAMPHATFDFVQSVIREAEALSEGGK